MKQEPSVLQALEQLQAWSRDFAPVVRSYYANLVEAGFTVDQALRLTVAWQASMLAMATGRKDPDAG